MRVQAPIREDLVMGVGDIVDASGIGSVRFWFGLKGGGRGSRSTGMGDGYGV